MLRGVLGSHGWRQGRGMRAARWRARQVRVGVGLGWKEHGDGCGGRHGRDGAAEWCDPVAAARLVGGGKVRRVVVIGHFGGGFRRVQFRT